MSAKLYVVHGSHPCATVQRALDLKAVPYKVVELLPPMHAALQRMRFGARTVPGLILDSGEKISGSRAIMRRLEELAPEPSLFPADPDALAEVHRAEEWGDEVWQPMARRLLWRTFTMHPQAMTPSSAGSTPRRRAPSAPTCSRSPATSTASTPGWPTASSAARPSTPPTCRSPRRRG
jgi:glutathione S-transferase